MAKVIAPFKISGTLDEINFVVTADGVKLCSNERKNRNNNGTIQKQSDFIS